MLKEISEEEQKNEEMAMKLHREISGDDFKKTNHTAEDIATQAAQEVLHKIDKDHQTNGKDTE